MSDEPANGEVGAVDGKGEVGAVDGVEVPD